MLRVIYSNRPGKLAEAFGTCLDAAVGLPPRDPFKPTELLVASRPLEAWLVRQLAPRAGIVANLKVRLLRRFTAALVARAFPDRRPLDGLALRDLLLVQFLEGAVADPALAPVRGYLGPRDATFERRACQLASELARVFEEYVYARREMLAAWTAGAASPLDGGRELAEWQRRLWQQTVERAGDAWVLPTALLEVPPAELVDPAEPLLVYGLSFIGTTYFELLAHLARATEVLLFAINPCREYWEDVEPARRRGRPVPLARVGADPVGLDGADCRLLALWGRPGREAVRLLARATDGDATAAFDEPDDDDPSLLRRLQADVLRRAPSARPAPPPATLPARDLELAPCPGVRRECEFVAGRIWALLSEPRDHPLRLDEIAVLVAPADPETYVAPLLAAFHDHHELPWQLVGIPHARTSPVVDAALLLLALPQSPMTRADVLRVLTHPVVAARFPDVDVDAWARWAASAGIVFGLDRAAHADTYVVDDLLSWDQGLRRIGLGAFLAADGGRGDGAAMLALGGERYLPDAAGQHLDEGAGALLLLARSLLADAAALRDARLPVAGWAATLATLLRTYLQPRDDLERRALDACLRAVRGLAAVGLGEHAIALQTAVELVEAELAEAGARTAGGVTGGVRITTLAASRGIPARVTFVVGLSEGAFPAGERAGSLDLRPAAPQPGDASGRERDQYMFLEALLATDERLVLSWVARDERSGEPREPSPVVTELRRLLDEVYLPDRPAGAPHPLTHGVPLWRCDAPPALDDVVTPSPQARRERWLRGAGDALVTAGGLRPPDTLARAVTAELAPAVRTALEAEAGLLDAPPAAPAPAGTSRRVTLPALRDFLACPLQGAAQARLRLGDEDEDDGASRTSEVFSSSRMTETMLLRRAFEQAWRTAGRVVVPDDAQREAAWEAQAAPMVARAELPLGPFLAAERLAGLDTLTAWAHRVMSSGRLPGAFRVIRLGEGDDDRVDEVVSAPTFSLPTPAGALTVQLVGRTQPLIALPGDDGAPELCSLVFITRTRAPDDVATQARHLVRAWLDQLALAVCGLAADRAHHLAVVCDAPAETLFMRLDPVSAGEARQRLEELLAGLLLDDNAVLAPLDELLAYGLDRAGGFRVHAPEASCAGPVRRVARFRAATDAEADALLDGRLAPLLRAVQRLHAPPPPPPPPVAAPPVAAPSARRRRGRA